MTKKSIYDDEYGKIYNEEDDEFAIANDEEEVSQDKKREIIKYYMCDGNHYANQLCPGPTARPSPLGPTY
eukprot:1595353-Ditylum_brightwellii.AAC.1